MLVYLVENYWVRGTHQRQWFLRISEMLTRAGHGVVAVCPDPESFLDLTAAWPGEQRRLIRGTCRIPEMPVVWPLHQRHVLGLFARARMWSDLWRKMRGHARDNGLAIDLVLFNYVDVYSIFLPPLAAWMRRKSSAPWIGLYFWLNRGELAFQKNRLVRRFLDRLAVFRNGHCKGLCVFDESMLRLLEGENVGQCWPMPDFTDPVTIDASSGLGLDMLRAAGGRRIVLVCGHLSPRKGFVDFLRLARESREEPWLFAAAGKLDLELFDRRDRPFIREMLAAPPPNLWIFPHRVPDEETFNDLVRKSNVLFCAYRNFPYSSGVLAKSAFFEKPTLVSNRYIMGERVRGFNLGRAVPEGDIAAMRSALQDLEQHPPPAAGFEAYRAYHCLERFEQELNRVLAGIEDGWIR